jgi:hypothetical protein
MQGMAKDVKHVYKISLYDGTGGRSYFFFLPNVSHMILMEPSVKLRGSLI